MVYQNLDVARCKQGLGPQGFERSLLFSWWKKTIEGRSGLATRRSVCFEMLTTGDQFIQT
jgi:hypothetical protein